MARAKEMLDLVNEREKNRMEMLNVERLIFQERVYLRKLRKHFKLNQIDNLDNSPDQKTRKKSKRGDGYFCINVVVQR
jgi:oligoendopeptidase F